MAGQMSPEVLELVANRFRVLSEPARLRILCELMEGERTVTELVEATELNQANLSKHLQTLRASGFVETQPSATCSAEHVNPRSELSLIKRSRLRR